MFPQTRKENVGMDYLAVPSALAWSKARVGGQSPIFRSSSLPPLDWPLPFQYEGLELRIEVQPRTHHRAHYETEGSRGAVKASPGGHPIVKSRAATRFATLSDTAFPKSSLETAIAQTQPGEQSTTLQLYDCDLQGISILTLPDLPWLRSTEMVDIRSALLERMSH
ncbi:unnamed protein product [Ranitomeya imitator]|uniref:RHD domain-containing protein n=1 Tax=Ranitomeya imitator TaxID=111125 RepID=A0ABN9M2E7_9NEOB|nr:unnamed protein product [Ranitomeya imitator]